MYARSRPHGSQPLGLLFWILGGSLLIFPPGSAAGMQEPAAEASKAGTQDPAAADAATGEAPRPAPLTEYMGRPIAQPMSYHGAPWLIRSEREEQERCSLLLANLGLRPGMTVCDLGCGNGYYTLALAELVGPSGRVLAVDIQPEMLGLLRERVEEAGLAHVTPILGSVDNPRLPTAAVDLFLLVDVYHEFSHPEPMLAAIRAALKPGGRVALVEFRAEDPKVPIRPEHKMSRAQILREFPANGLVLDGEFDRLPWQHLLFFTAGESRGE